ncbi:hypothetical protein WJS89_02050 [Sphingomicrobium sp. XHP0235]|uniref:hypothetical protein n=1 Tax=Sphingomicrobium aquimarinum TaxID=3133971 RepID=UPI0031FF2D29
MSGNMAGFGAKEAGALLQWWQQSGVDTAISSNAPSWRSLAALKERARADAPVVTDTPEGMPEEKAAVSVSPRSADAPAIEPLPDATEAIPAWLERRSNRLGARHVSAELTHQAPLVIIVARPLDGETGVGADNIQLFDAMLKAIDCAGAATLFLDPAFLEGQSARAPLEADLVTAARGLLRDAKPQRLLVFGDGASRALFDAPIAKARGKLHRVEGIPAVATFHPRGLRDRPADKRFAWQDMLILMGA